MTFASLEAALAAHRSGDFGAAENLYRDVLDAEPENSEAWRLLAALKLDSGHAVEALTLIERARALSGDDPLAALTHGSIFMVLGRTEDAVEAFRSTLAGAPGLAAAETNLGNALRMLRRHDEALEHCRRGVALAPDLAEAHHNLGAVLLEIDRAGDAANALRRAIELAPGLLGARVDLARAYVKLGDRAAARAEADRAAAAAPGGALANLLGTIYFELALLESARRLFARALADDPENAQALNNLGNALTRSGEADAAIVLYERALATDRDNPTYLANLGAAHQAAGDIATGLGCLERALMIDPSHADARWNRGLARLVSGDLAGGFADYEARWSLPEFTPRRFTVAKWDGGDVAGRTILVHSEQGYGDTIQMARFAAALKERGARVVVETHAPLKRLMETAEGVDAVVTRGETLPRFDLQVPMMSLPGALRVSAPSDIPARVPYLRARDDAPARLPARAAGELRVGIAWAGRATHKHDRHRSVPLDALAPLAACAGVRLHSLQVGETAAELDRVPWRVEVVDLAPQLSDFAVTAAAIGELDLVISVDTAVAHLAGALAKPCWVLLPFAPDWRWLLDRADSPWYPTLRLFRQRTAGDWSEPIARVVAALGERVRASR